MSADTAAVEAALKQFEGLYPDKIELSLGRIEALLDALGRPQDRLPPTIHVAGTNGKGSTCAYLRAMAEEAAGLSAYMSIHRRTLCGSMSAFAWPESWSRTMTLIAWIQRVYDALEGREITRFEATTAVAQCWPLARFRQTLLILEVGLGGRFDATNVDRTLRRSA